MRQRSVTMYILTFATLWEKIIPNGFVMCVFHLISASHMLRAVKAERCYVDRVLNSRT